MASESAEIRAPGVPITLRDGRARRLRFGMLAIKHLEDKFGSTAALDRELRAIAAYLQGQDTEGSRVFSTVFDVVSAGLIREKLTEEQLDDLLDFSKVHEYAVATNQALTEAFGELSEEEMEGKAAAVKTAGRGANGGTRRRSSSTAKTKSSGETTNTPE